MTWANSEIHVRALKKIEGRKGRRKCHCGCGTRSTHIGTANGIALTSGCELFVRRWVRDGLKAIIQRRRLTSTANR